MVTTSRGQRYRDQRDIKRALTALTACALLCALALTPLVRPGLAEAPGSLAANGIVPLSGGGYLSVVPVSSSIDLGETVDVEIWINDVEDFYGLDFCLSFNEDLVSVPSNNGTLLYEVFDPAPMHTFLLFNNVGTAATAGCGCTPETGKRYYHLAITNLNPAVPFTGSGRVVRLTFRG